MKLAVLCFFILSISTGLAQVLSNPPEFKVAFDYSMIDIMQANIIRPFIESKIKDIQLNQTFSVNKLGITASIGNISIYDFSLDWNNTQILGVNANNQPAIMIEGLNVTVQFDADIKFLGLHFPGQADQISIVNMDLEIALGFGTLPNETSYAYIASVTPSIQTINSQLSPKLEQFLVVFIQKLGNVFGLNLPDIICNLLTTQIEGFNQTVINMTTQGVNQVLLDILQVQLSLADAPQIFNVDHDAYQALSFNLEITDVQTGGQAITAVSDNLPPYVDGGLPIQVLLSENMISQLLWAVLQSGKVNLVMSQGNVPAGFPVPLNTDALKILFPDIAQACGAGHGVYIQIQKGGDYPIAFIRDGRLVAEVSLQVDVYVDEDDDEYPVKELATCKNCTDYVTLNVTAFAALDVYAINSTFLGAKLMNVEIGNVGVLNGTLDAPLFRTTLNGLIVPIMGQLNLQIAEGFQNPVIGMFGIDNFAIELGPDYLLVGLSMEVASNQEDSDDINMLSSYLTGFI